MLVKILIATFLLVSAPSSGNVVNQYSPVIRMNDNTYVRPHEQQLNTLDGMFMNDQPVSDVSKGSFGASRYQNPQQNRIRMPSNVPIAPQRGSRNSETNQRRPNAAAPLKRSNNPRVSEGHRLITRALWRIFDALMEKNENQDLTARLITIENNLRTLETPDTKLESLIEMAQKENKDQNQRIDLLSTEVVRLMELDERVSNLEEWKKSFLQSDEEKPDGDYVPVIPKDVPPRYHPSCPSPFDTVDGECFFVSMGIKRTWVDARRDCSRFGGDLAAPNDIQTLKDYLQNLPNKPEYVWVGASRTGNGTWLWSTGPKDEKKVDMTYVTWNEDLPSGMGNCMGLYEGAAYRAYDYHCTELDMYVCQFFL